MVSLPECFNSPYGTKYFPEYAEPIEGGPTCKALKEAAEKHKVKISLNISLFISCRRITLMQIQIVYQYQ